MVGRTNKRSVLASLGWYDPRFFEAIGRYARHAGWHLATRSMMEASDPTGWKGDGMLVNDAEVPRLAGFIRSQAKLQATVLFGANHEGIHCPSVEEDNYECGRLAAEHFLERGYRNFCWTSISRGRVERDRGAGFIAALADAGRDCTLMNHSVDRGKRGDSWTARRRWLKRGLSALAKPVAIFALDDILASDVIETSVDSGFLVPADVAVMGAGNIELACDCSPVPISSIDLNFGEVAYRAAELLNRLMDGETVPDQAIIIPVRGVVSRASSDMTAVAHPGIAKVVEMIRKRYGENIGVEEMAMAAGVSRRMLHYVFAEELRRTPAEYLRRVRLDEAKRRLLKTDGKVSSIAVECGFSTDRNLHRCFVRETGLPPQTWRVKQRLGS